jgi:hypothetical protein
MVRQTMVKKNLRTVIRTVGITVLLVSAGIAAGCATSPGGTPTSGSPSSTASGSPSSDSGVQGVTTVDGGCPVIRSGTPCPDRPIAAHLTVTDANGATVTSIDTDSAGHFRITLAPGTYVIHPTNRTGAIFPVASPVTITVSAGTYATVKIPFDSGIR